MLAEEIEMLRGQMQEMTAREAALLDGLASTLKDTEQRLLAQVRAMTEQHQVRRYALVEELRALATGFGSSARPMAEDHGIAAGLTHAPPQVTYEASVVPMSGSGASWREATRMIGDDEEDLGLQQLLRASAR